MNEVQISWRTSNRSPAEPVPAPAPGVIEAKPRVRQGRWRRLVPGKATVALILAFWIVWFGVFTAFNYFNAQETFRETFWRRVIATGVGVVLSFGIAASLEGLRDRTLLYRGVAAIGLTAGATILHSLISEWVWWLFGASPPRTVPLLAYYASDFILRAWYFGSQSGIILALSYASDVHERERRIRTLQGLAHAAQMRALRNQLNPHFLFNALNSVAALISAGRSEQAEQMTEDLSDFLRSTLRLDPQQLISLADELELQALYLRIEQSRFPDRLKVDLQVPDALLDALVPSLLTQPLIENSIKHAVAQSSKPVTISVSARTVDDCLELVIANDAGDAPAPMSAFAARTKGTRFGLVNVAERIRLHFGDDARFVAEPLADGGFSNLVRIPLRSSELS